MDDLVTVHATCVAINDDGVLLAGPPGAGKSDLALRLISSGAVLVGDDQVIVRQQAERLIVSAPKNLQGLLEVRGIGICSYPFMKECKLTAVFDLEHGTTPERLPDLKEQTGTILGLQVARVRLDPFHASAVAKVYALLTSLQQGKLPATDR